MEKIIKRPGDEHFRAFHPDSIVLISAVDREGRADICTVGAWSLANGCPSLYGIAMCTQSIPPAYFKRYTTTCIEETGEFVINIPHLGMSQAWELCGTRTLTQEKKLDKFQLAGLTQGKPVVVKAPLIEECPVNIECRVHSKLSLPSHDWIVGEPVAIHTARDVAEGKRMLQWVRAPKYE
ncbi:MAG: flavin reductase family protein [bacterium]